MPVTSVQKLLDKTKRRKFSTSPSQRCEQVLEETTLERAMRSRHPEFADQVSHRDPALVARWNPTTHIAE